ncbi:uncharacterized protein N7511_006291 [Penicillium nucicola]|uniref:uncharacterized protein n=1 Tax=Penicillium nucicola TaxID=1850975 RepID=UPI0025451891|nr:uncharacterized protein N7511_006291 [Penicillium nucicola]KAJ5757597.1 hypothetical protein N7511_006291 [Penicillium nucicola]
MDSILAVKAKTASSYESKQNSQIQGRSQSTTINVAKLENHQRGVKPIPTPRPNKTDVRHPNMTIQFPIMSLDYFQPSPAKRFVSLTKHPGVLGGQVHIFTELKPVHPDELIGEWDGYILATGHPFEEELETLNWFGNTFDSMDDVAPLMVARHGERVRFEDWGRASVSTR